MKISVSNLYDVIIEPYSLRYLKDYFNTDIKSLVITDDLIPVEYVTTVLKQLKDGYCFVMKHGEHNKNLDTVKEIYEVLLKNEFDRKSQIICLGGGIVGDLGGYVASTFKRGIDFINIPTTTLSMIDSSVGGKVAVNFNGVKNIIGSFYQPKLVLIDESVLDTLPKRHLYNGLVEALKMGLCLNRKLYNIFLEENFLDKISDIIKLSVETKRKIVEVDPKEMGVRKVLNFGHTFGHAVESLYLDDIYHGEAVACGMIDVIRNIDLRIEVLGILKRFGISTSIKEEDTDKIIELLKNDKKRNKEVIDFVMLNDVEEYEFVPLTINDAREILKEGV